MFIRTKTSPNTKKIAVQIVQSIRDGKTVKQKIVRHVGHAMNEDELGRLKDLATYIMANMEDEQSTMIFDPMDIAQRAIEARRRQEEQSQEVKAHLENLKEEQRIIVGIHDVYGSVFDEIGFGDCLSKVRTDGLEKKVIKNLVLSRLASPGSKRKSVADLSVDFGIELDLDKVYRSMDKLDDAAIQKIQDRSYQMVQSLFPDPINVVFYDCTTLYFESFEEDELRLNGYSKDGKFNQAQVLLALLVTPAGLPIGYELYPGNTFEGSTLQDAIHKIRIRYKVDKLIFVADSAMLSKSNIEYLDGVGQPYIVAARLKTLPAEWKEKVTDMDNYQPIENQTGISLAVFNDYRPHTDLIITHSVKRAAKDQHDREKAIRQITKRLEKSKQIKGVLNNYGYKKYLKVEGQSTLTINEDKINEAKKWDGLHGIITNVKEMTPEEILAHYKSLWQIEETFRITKHDHKIRPIYHFKPERVRAHIAICFMALVCARILQYRTNLQYHSMSIEAIRTALVHTQLSILRDKTTNKLYGLPSKLILDAKKLYQLVGLKLSDQPFPL